MTPLDLLIQPGEISIVLGNDMYELSDHACKTAKELLDRGISLHLVNCGIMSRRFWDVANREIGEKHIKHRKGGVKLRIETAIRGNLYGSRDLMKSTRKNYETKVLIICGWEWTSRDWQLKQNLIFHLREIAEEEEVAIIIYSQARTSPSQGFMDRGGIGKLATIAYTIIRIDEEEEKKKEKKIEKPTFVSSGGGEALGGYKGPETFQDIINDFKKRMALEQGEQPLLSANEINGLNSPHAENTKTEFVKEFEEEEVLEYA